MGKRTKGKRQNKSNHSLQKPKSNDDNKKDGNNSSVLLQRIRHADPRTRHAALAAVANTLLDPSSSRKGPPKISVLLLQAIRERVLDADLDVSQVAAGCLANYVTIAAAALDQNPMVGTQSMTAGWTLVLVGRLKQCLVPLLEEKVGSPTKKVPPIVVAKHQKQWLALAVQCFRALCLLTETNPEAVGRWTSSIDATPRREFHQTVLEWMQHCQQYYATAASKVDVNDAFLQYYEQIATLAARTIHSAWDDNADLLLPWKEECPDAFRKAIELLETIVKQPQPQTSRIFPVVAQLHCIGAFWTARPLMATQQAVTMTQSTVLPKLTDTLSKFSWSKTTLLLQAYQQAMAKWEEEQADDALEKDVIRKVEERQEPSREIARRQKAQKEAQKKKKKHEQEEKKDNCMVEEGQKEPKADEAMQEDNVEEQHKQQVETQQALEQARVAWNQFLLPLQLSLELLANFTSQGAPKDDPNEEDMMDEDWGPDQEAQWMQEQEQATTIQQRQSAEDLVLQSLLLTSALPLQLKQLWQQVYQVPQGLIFPEQSREDIGDLQSKTMACLGNCWENIPQWPAEESWAELQQAAMSASGVGKEGLVSAMVVALRTFPAARKQWQPEHLAFWLDQLGNSSQSASVRRDVITMFGILCSQEPHPVEVNQKICSALLVALTNDSSDSVMIPCEVLNVLMDMYGNDDENDGCCHGSVFESLQVLGHFQRSIPTLKSKLKQQNMKGVVDKVEIEQWKETLINANRFVQYKKGQL